MLVACGTSANASPRPPVASGARFGTVTITAGSPPDATVHFTEAGLLANQAVNIAVTADTLASYSCAPPGSSGFTRAPLPVTEQTAALGHFHAGADGTLDATLTLHPPVPPGAPCNPGDQVRPVRARYSNGVLSDLTNQVRVPVTGTVDSGA